jgi:sigma-B regulation protein RsbU (phosphoserine phosphatase)
MTRELRYVTAGYPGLVHVRRDAHHSILESDGIPVGLVPEASYEERAVRLEPGDRLYFATDGAHGSGEHRRAGVGAEKLL